VYGIDEKMLGNLDILEAYPKLYTRREEKVQVEMNDGSSKLFHAWTYLLIQFSREMLDLPHLSSYSSTGPHNLPYMARYLRDKILTANDLELHYTAEQWAYAFNVLTLCPFPIGSSDCICDLWLLVWFFSEDDLDDANDV